MMISRPATGSLAPFIGRMWATDSAEDASTERELVLPTGAMYVVFRLDGPTLRTFDDLEGTREHIVANAVIGGVRSNYYVRDISQPVKGVGVELLPGAARLLLGAPTDQFAQAHVALHDVWSPTVVESMRDELACAADGATQLDVLERLLRARMPKLRGLHPAVAEGLSRLTGEADVGTIVRDSGYSHRGFNNLFSAEVGLTPKRYARVHRFAAALARLHGADEESLAALALACGYSDQAHFTREFREFAGVSPGRYRALCPTFAHHVPLR